MAGPPFPCVSPQSILVGPGVGCDARCYQINSEQVNVVNFAEGCAADCLNPKRNSTGPRIPAAPRLRHAPVAQQTFAALSGVALPTLIPVNDHFQSAEYCVHLCLYEFPGLICKCGHGAIARAISFSEINRLASLAILADDSLFSVGTDGYLHSSEARIRKRKKCYPEESISVIIVFCWMFC